VFPISALASLPLVASAPAQDAPETMRPVVRGTRAVIAAGTPATVEAGMRILRAGGNAVDGGVAALFAAAASELSHFGFGGEVPILIRTPAGAVSAINGQGPAPGLATREAFLERGEIPAEGVEVACVPGVLDAGIVALLRFGTRSFEEVVAPAIELAEGFPFTELLEERLRRNEASVRKWPTSAAILLPGGKAPRPGDLLVQRDLAATLRDLVAAERAKRGEGREAGLEAVRDRFYRGPIARRIAEFVEKEGGFLRAEDFAAFRAEVEEPVKTSFRGYEVYKCGFWCQGPALLETLNILEGFDLRAMGQNSPRYVHSLTEAMKLAFADRDAAFGDPAFVPPPTEVLTKEYAARRRALLDPERASRERRPGVGNGAIEASVRRREGGSGDTTCINAIDAEGTMFSATPSGAWFPSVIAGDTGIPLSQRLQAFVLDEGHPNVLAPGKRPRMTLTPTLVTRDGKPSLAISTPGGDVQDQAILQAFLNVVEFGMNPQQAVEAPRFDTAHLQKSFAGHAFRPAHLALEMRFPEATIRDLAERGHDIEIRLPWGSPSAVTIVTFDPDRGVISAGADPRRYRYAAGW